MDDDVAELVREERLVEAAELLRARGNSALASVLLERACRFSAAALEALRADDFGRALVLAIEGGDDAVARAALDRVARQPDAALVADRLVRRGAHAWAAQLFEALGQAREAAEAWERAGEAEAAARQFDAIGEPRRAARVLEIALRAKPDAHALALALARLLARHKKPEAAIRVAQHIPEGAPERRDAAALLVDAFAALGLERARDEAHAELERLGGQPVRTAEEPAPPAGRVRTILFGRYELVREVASSATARVLQCIDTLRGDPVALKLFSAIEAKGAGRDALARFEREVRVFSKLDHPNVVPLRDYIPEGPALVLGWMGGGTLEARMREGELSPARAVEVAGAVLRALAQAHRLGVLHRDIKPSNVLFDDAGGARLSDFGVAHLGDVSTTATAAVIGTLAYMSPEQRDGRPATVRSDLYGVGAVLFEMLTRERPTAEGEPRVRPSGRHRDLDARHDAVVAKLLAKAADARPADALEALRILSSVPWPDRLEPPASVEASPATEEPARVDHERVVVDAATGTPHDTWAGRPIARLPLTEDALKRARAFARAGHPSLQLVLRVARSEGALWLEPLPSGRVSAPLSPADVDALANALSALHAEGVAHGQVDREHVRVDERGRITLAFTAHAAPMSTPDRDRVALARLARGDTDGA